MKDHKEDGSKQARTRKYFPRRCNGGTNVCNRPGLGASKIDLQDLHDEKMRNKRLRYHAKNKHGRPIFQTHRHRPTSELAVRPSELAGRQVRWCAQQLRNLGEVPQGRVNPG